MKFFSAAKRFYKLKDIAVVGMSENEEKPSRFAEIPSLMWYNIIPINPIVTEVFGKKSHPKYCRSPGKDRYNDVFKRSEDAEKKVKENGIDVVYNRCIMAEHRCLLG